MSARLSLLRIWMNRFACLFFCALLFSTGGAAQRQSQPSPANSREVVALFSEEIQQAVIKLKWRGERLTEDTVYAVALTGLSWEPAWGKDHLFAVAGSDSIESSRQVRQARWDVAQNNRDTRTAIAYALSLLLEPGTDPPMLHQSALGYLDQQGVDVNRVMLGILQAPDKLRGLPRYVYAAADILAMRAVPRLLPFLMHLAQSDDVHLRSRAIIGLGVLAYRARSGDSPDWGQSLVTARLREFGLSSGERKLIEREFREAVNSDRYRLRAAAAIALSLAGEDTSLPLLQKLAKDRAYVLSEAPKGVRNPPRRILFPVRMAACAGLARFGHAAEPGGGILAGKDLDKAKKGGQDVTKDRNGLRREVVSQIFVSSIDVATAVPISL
jgi:hypothetical protein